MFWPSFSLKTSKRSRSGIRSWLKPLLTQWGWATKELSGGGGALMRNFMLYIPGPNETWVRRNGEEGGTRDERKVFYYTQLYLFNLARVVFRTSTETGRWEMPWYIKTRKEKKKMNSIWRLCQNRPFISRKLVEQMSLRQDCQTSSLLGEVLPGNRLCPSKVPL